MPDVTDLVVPYNGVTVVALLFETVRAPFVVRNPLFGSVRGEIISHEVPWREGTSIRSASRSNLIKLLIPSVALPEIEILSAELIASKSDRDDSRLNWNLSAKLYLVSQVAGELIIPKHRCEFSFEVQGVLGRTSFSQIFLSAPSVYGVARAIRTSLTVESTSTEVIVNGAGLVMLSASASSKNDREFSSAPARIVGTIRTAHDDRPIVIALTLAPSGSSGKYSGEWKLERQADAESHSLE